MKKICPLCGAENEENARFCKECSEPLYDIKAEEERIRAEANAKIEEERGREERGKEWIPDNSKEVKSKDKSSELFLADLVKQNVNKKKGFRTCGNCGASLPDGVTRCSECGKTVCKNCGNILGTGVTKCPKCGELTTIGTIQSIGFSLFVLGIIIYILLFIFVFI